MTTTTKKYKYLARLWFILEILCLVAPLIGFGIYAYVNGTTVEKVSIGISWTVALILTAINLITKKHLRSPLWIMLIGLYIGLKELLPVLIIMCVVTVLDEFVFSPLYKLYKDRYEAAKVAEQVNADLK